jgi:hypothetical protein
VLGWESSGRLQDDPVAELVGGSARGCRGATGRPPTASSRRWISCRSASPGGRRASPWAHTSAVIVENFRLLTCPHRRASEAGRRPPRGLRDVQSRRTIDHRLDRHHASPYSHHRGRGGRPGGSHIASCVWRPACSQAHPRAAAPAPACHSGRADSTEARKATSRPACHHNDFDPRDGRTDSIVLEIMNARRVK